MGRPRKWANDAERQQAHRDRHGPHTRLASFIGVDGEGTGNGADHKYVLLSVGRESIDSGMGGDLGFAAIMDLLYSQYLANPGVVFGGFFLSYDFNRILRLLPEAKARRLFDPASRQRRPVKCVDKQTGEIYYEPDGRGPFPVTYEGYEIDLLGMRRLKLRPEGAKSWMYVNDAGPFFQTSFLKAIDPDSWNEPIVTPEEYKTIKEGKDNRDVAILGPDMRAYNVAENVAWSKLMGCLDEGFRAAGIRLGKDQWFGPGQAAQAWLDNVKCPTSRVVSDACAANRVRPALRVHTELRDIPTLGRMSYYGGWFEIFAHGHIPDDSWEYDINSAYPHIIRSLPCLLHGRWVRDDSPIRQSEEHGYRIVNAGVFGSDPVCGAMLHRRPDCSILRPSQTEGWYWEHELQAAMRAGVVYRTEIHDGWRYTPCDCLPPLRGLAGLYDARLRVGKDTPEGKAYKLLYNSVYGKFAQNIGEPKYNNYLYASLITAGCRSMILDAIATHPEKTNALLMVATDGVYFRSRHPSLPLSSALGEWGEARKRNLTLFKPGVYWDDDARDAVTQGGAPRFKARGVNAREFSAKLQELDDQFSRWKPGDVHPRVTFRTTFSMTTCQQALQRGKWETAGSVGSMEVTQDADPTQKRTGPYTLDSSIWRSSPYLLGGPVAKPGEVSASTPYREDSAKLDHEQYGINDDGTVEDAWRILHLGSVRLSCVFASLVACLNSAM